MSPHDEISSTEKLLDVIRGDDTVSAETSGTSPVAHSTVDRKSGLARIIPFKKPMVVGVDIGHADLRLVKVMRSSDQKWRLLDYSCVPYKPEVPKGSPGFANFLKSALSEFCGSSKRLNIWCVISSDQVDIRHVLIPKVAKKQIADAVYWTVKKQAPFDEKETVFDFEVQGDVIENGVRKIAVTAYTAPKQEVEEIKNLFSKSGFPLTGITIAPFALQNLFRTGWIPAFDQTVASLHIGYEWSRIDIFSQGNLVLTRDIKAGVKSMIESLVQGLNERKKGGSPVDMEQARRVLFSLSPDSVVAEEDGGFQLKDEEVFEMIHPAVDRLVRQVERTFEHYTITLGNESVGKIYIYGGISAYRPFIDYIGGQLGIDREIIDPLDPAAAPLLDDTALPGPVSSGSPFALAVGLALSDNSRTPNLVFTYKDKEKGTSITRINRTIFAGFMLFMLVCLGVFIWQGRVTDQKKASIAGLQQQLVQYSPRLNQDFILQMADSVKEHQRNLKENSKRYLAVAVMSELSALTPTNVRLLSVKAGLGSLTKDEGKSAEKSFVVDGIILGERQMLEASLVRYMMSLESSPIFSTPMVHQSALESWYGKGEVLHFTLELELV